MSKIQRGDLDLLGVLYSRHSARVFKMCFRVVPDPAVAEDLVQDSFIRVLRYRKNYRGDAQFTTWLYRIVRNVCIDHIGKKKRERDGFDALIARNGQANTSTPPDTSEMSATKRAFDALRPDQQSLLVMSRIDGVGYKELAAFFDSTEGAIRVKVHRALRDLRKGIDELRSVET